MALQPRLVIRWRLLHRPVLYTLVIIVLVLLIVYTNQNHGQHEGIAAETKHDGNKRPVDVFPLRVLPPIVPPSKVLQNKERQVNIKLNQLRLQQKSWAPASRINNRNGIEKQNVQIAVEFRAKVNSTGERTWTHELIKPEVENVIQLDSSRDHAQLLYTKKVNSSTSIVLDTKRKLTKNDENLKIFEDIMKLTNDSTVIYEKSALSRSEKLTMIRKLYSTELSGPRTPKFKNPCHCMFWEESDKNRCFHTGCLPYFYLIGAPKCGTTDLWFNINAHPDILQLEKEPHWWSKLGKTGLDFRKYMFHYSEALIETAKPGVSPTEKLIMGDGSASTLWNNINIVKQTYDATHRLSVPFTWADVINVLQPDAKIITMLRNPVARLISDYFAFEDNPSAQDFHNKIIEAVNEFNGCLEKFDLRFCANLNYNPRIQIGVYVVHIREWLEAFPANQVYILRTEDWHNDKGQRLLPKIFSFLEIEPLGNESLLSSMDTKWRQNVIDSKVMSKKYAAEYSRIDSLSRELIQEFYKPYNQQLAHLLRDPSFDWTDS